MNKRDEIQAEALTEWKRAVKGVVILPTGFGKTRVGVMAAKDFDPSDVLVVTSRLNLIGQWKKEFKLMGQKPPEILCINTAYKKERNVKLLIVDEAHRTTSPEFSKLYDNVQTEYTLLLTATKPKEDLPYPVVYEKSLEEAVEASAVSDFQIYNVGVALAKNISGQYKVFDQMFKRGVIRLSQLEPDRNAFDLAKIYKDKQGHELHEAARAFWTGMSMRKNVVYSNPEKAEAAKKIIKALPDKKWIVFFKKIADAEKFALSVPGAKVYHSKQKKGERALILQAFSKNKFNILVSVDALNEGLNVPEVDAAICVAGVSSQLVAIQQLGRVLRFKQGKKAIFINLYTKATVEERWLKTKLKKFTQIIDLQWTELIVAIRQNV